MNLDLWFARRENIFAPWKGPLINPGPLVNSYFDDIEPCILESVSAVIFTSNRPDGFGNYDLWKVPIIQNPDLNRDNKIDIEDLEILIKKWGKGLSQADIAPLPFGDGQVDKKDLDVFVQYMMQELNKPME